MNSELSSLIRCYLNERRESHGGYAEIEPQDITNLGYIVQKIVELKCEKDPDGDLPIEFVIVDRTKERKFHPVTVPYETEGDDPLKRGGKIDSLISGISSSIQEIENDLDCMRRI